MSGPRRGPDPRAAALLVGLRMRVATRAFRGHPVAGLLAAAGLVAGLVALGAGAVLSRSWLLRLVAAGQMQLADAAVHACHLAVFLLVVAAPTVRHAAEEAGLPGGMVRLPVSGGTRVLAGLLAGFAGPAAGGGLVLLLAVGAGRAGAAGVATTLVAGGSMVAAGLALGLLAAAALRSVSPGRAGREAAGLALSLGGVAAAVILVLVLGGPDRATPAGAVAVLAGRTDLLVFLPSWWAANAVVGPDAARFLPALGLPVLCLWALGAAARQTERADRARGAPSRARGPLLPDGFVNRLLPRSGWLVGRELRLLRREPAARGLLLRNAAAALLPAAILLGAAVTAAGAGVGRPPAWTATAVGYLLLLAEMPLFVNLLGLEGAGLATVLRTPLDRVRLVRAKAVAAGVLLGGTNALLAAAAGLLSVGTGGGAGPVAAAAGEAFLATLVGAAGGAALSVLAPVPVASGRGLQQGSGGALQWLRSAVMVPAGLLVVVPVPMLLRFAPGGAGVLVGTVASLAWAGLWTRLGGAWLAGGERAHLPRPDWRSP